MSSRLHNTLLELSTAFAADVLAALRSASLEEILAESGRQDILHTLREQVPLSLATREERKGRMQRLQRRSMQDIDGVVSRILDLLHEHPAGLRAEEIRLKLGIDAKELPRPLGAALSSGLVHRFGQKRATTYTCVSPQTLSAEI